MDCPRRGPRRFSRLEISLPRPRIESGKENSARDAGARLARCKRRRVTHPRWSLRRARLLTLRRRINDESPMGKPVAGRTNGTQPNDFSPRLQRAFQRHEFAPRRELMETRRGMPYALIKRNVRLLSSPISLDPLSIRRRAVCSVAFAY